MTEGCLLPISEVGESFGLHPNSVWMWDSTYSIELGPNCLNRPPNGSLLDMRDLEKHPSEITEAERWERFRRVLVLGIAEAVEEGRIPRLADIPAAVCAVSTE